MRKSVPTPFRQEVAFRLASVRTSLLTSIKARTPLLQITLCLALAALSQTGTAQLTGVKTIPGDYASVAAAVTDLNVQGVGAGGVIFNVAAGHTETSDVPQIEATGTAVNTIVFQKSGVGDNPVITRLSPGTVTSSTTLGNNGDGIIVINGGDFITFDGIDVQTDASFSGAGFMEYGFYLKKASGEDACKDVTIKNCNITLNKAAVYSFGVFVSNISGTSTVTVTSTGGRSENISIFNNNISNAYGGVQLRGFNHTTAPYDFYDQNVEVGEDGGNSISNFGGGGTTVYGIYAIYQNNCKMNNNTISGGDGTTTTQWGIFVSTANNGNFDINDNTISMTNNATTSQVVGIGTSISTTNHTDNTINIIGNTLTNFSRPSATTGVTYFIYSTSNSPININITDNIIGSSSLSGTGAVYGISQISTPDNVLIDNNTISMITREGTTSTASFYGINCTGSSSSLNSTISNNTIHSLTGSGSSGAVGGINLGSNADCNVFNNKIYNITSNHNSGTVYGITVGAVSDGNIYNNLIGGLNAPSTGDATATDPTVRGINITSTLANSTRNVSFNTILLNASSTGTNFGTAGIMTLGSATATSGVLELRNNIIVNNSTANGTGNTVAYQRSTDALNNYGSSSNNNLFYAGVPGPSNLIFFDGTNADQTLSAFKARVAPFESLSVTENPTFLSVDGSSADFLHLDPAVPTQVESSAVPIAGIDDDFDGTPRNPATPDIGADEGVFILVDLSGPTIAYDDIPNSICISSIDLNAVVNDATGVDGSAGTRPRLWFKKSTESNSLPPANTSAENGWKWVEASNSSSPFSFSIDYSLLTSPVVSGDTIDYFVVAQDLVSTPNVGTNTAIYPGGFTPVSVALEVSAFPVSGFKSYAIINAPVTINTVASPDQICISGDVTLSLSGDPSSGAEYQWESSPAGANNWTPIAGATSSTYVVEISASTDFRNVITCGGTPIAASPSTVATVTVSNPMVLTTTPGGECGPGPVSVMLGATGSAGADLNWYDVPTDGTSLGTGTTFNTPPISTTTTFYVGASDGGSAGSVGPLDPSIGTISASNIAIGTQRMFFDVITEVTIVSMDIFPTAAVGSNGSITIRDNTQTVLFDVPYVTTVTGGNLQTVTLNVSLPPGTAYEIGQGTAINLNRNTTGAVYPYTSAAINITGNTFDPEYYYFYYNWQWITGCESPRTPVIASIFTNQAYYQDSDGDNFGNPNVSQEFCVPPMGWSADNTDCDDTDPEVNPGATEICNGIDDNCDGNIDEGGSATLWYADGDGDGFGNPDLDSMSCLMPVGYVDNDDDCDDTNGDVNPDAIEICNGIDDNCDGNIDEGGSATLWYADGDGDGFGNPDLDSLSCTMPVGYVDNGDDCDDTNGDVNPDAIEICNGIDDNCDGNIDESGSATTWYLDGDGDSFGNPDVDSVSCIAPPGYVANNTDCDDLDPNVNPAASEICNGIDDNCNGLIDDEDPLVTGQSTWYADTDGDSFGDAASDSLSCDQPVGYVSNDDDCDDTDPFVNPGAQEVCNSIDDDCDGLVDDEDPSVSGQTTWYADSDADGFGAPGSDSLSCDQPVGYVSNDEDCDDTNDEVNPLAIEICNGIDDNCDGNIDESGSATTWYLDGDGDSFGNPDVDSVSCMAPPGYVADNTDCDDLDPNVNPAASEICNGIDDNCNGLIDDEDPLVSGQSTWYADTDGDGFGDAASDSLSCDQPVGYVSNDEDCDDTDPLVNPNAQEVCNDIDDDCDGLVDDQDPSVTGGTWYTDTDGDGFGDAASDSLSCDQPIGYVSNDEDCDDTDPLVNPNAQEVCNDIDDDCDGLIDDDDPDVTGQSTWYADADGDGFGNAFSPQTACDQPVGFVANDDDCDDTDPEVNPDAPEVCNNIDDDCDGLVDGDDPDFTGDQTWYQDLDGDTFGNPNVSQVSCAQPMGYVLNDEDCDDTDPLVNPDATEICNDIDDDCDGLIDSDDPDVVGQSSWYADTDGDGFGDAANSATDCDQPIGFVANDDDCDDTDPLVNPDATEICNGIDDNCNNLTDEGCPGLMISITDTTVVNETAGSVTLQVTLSLPATELVTVSYRTINGTAIAGQDYREKIGILQFSPGQTVKNVTIPIFVNGGSEPDEFFLVRIFNAQGGGASIAYEYGVVIITESQGMVSAPTSESFALSGNVNEIASLQSWTLADDTGLFVPNPQSKYETFQVAGLIQSFDIVVTDVHGRTMFAQKDYQNDWLMSSLSDGIYLYQIRYVDAADKTILHIGKLVVSDH